MNLFNKKKPTEEVIAYSPVEQNTPPAPTPPPPSIDEQLATIIRNQGVIAGNQQTILNSITATQQLIVQLSQEPAEQEEQQTEEQEPEEEEPPVPVPKRKYRRK